MTNRRIVIILAVLHCLAFIDRTMIGGVLPLIRRDIAMNDAQAGWIIGTAFALPYGAAALGLAAVLRRRRASLWWLVGGVVIWTGASIAAGAARSVETLTLARAGLGIGQALFVPVAIAGIVDAAGSDGRARALATFTSGSTIGRSIALLVTGATLSLLAVAVPGGGIAHWRMVFFATAVPNLLIVPLLVAARRTPGETRAAAATAVPTAVDWRALALFFAVAIMPVLLSQAIGGWLPTLFVRDRGLMPAQAATLIGAITLVAAPAGQIAGGWLMSRRPDWSDHIPAIILAGLTVTLAPLALVAWAPGLIGAAIGVVGLNLTLGIASFCGLFGVQALIPAPARVSVNGIYFAFVTLVGFGVGPLLTGALAMASASTPAALGNALLMTGMIASALCAIAVFAVRGGYRRRVSA